MPTLDRSRVPAKPPFAASPSRLPSTATRSDTAKQSSGAIDHWSIVLLYSVGIGTLAVTALLFTVLMAVWMYGQFVWTFTHWDLANVRLTPFKTLAYSVIGATFLVGTSAGLWIFSGAAWRNQKSERPKATSVKRGSR